MSSKLAKINSTDTLLKFGSEDLSKIAQEILSRRPIDKSLYVYSTEILQSRLSHLKEVFPHGSNHAVAIKSNSHPKVLAEIVKNGCGLEAASIEEVRLAKEAGCPTEKIVFDSPVKTVDEIMFCAKELGGMVLNANCFEELDRLKAYDTLKVGIRINPLVDIGSPGIFNVSVSNSKFGIPITYRDRIVQYALEMDNIQGLHIHAGSEIGSQENHVAAIALIVDVAEEIRNKGKKLSFIDIGGGISANVKSLQPFFEKLIAKSPEILDYQIITEYGRFVQTHCAFAISKVEYVLTHCQPEIALIHVGADLFPREIYSSSPPKHEFYVSDPDGRFKGEVENKYDIGGPLCFSGDFLGLGLKLPVINGGDYVVISDAGANSLSMWSRHCSREEVDVEMI